MNLPKDVYEYLMQFADNGSTLSVNKEFRDENILLLLQNV